MSHVGLTKDQLADCYYTNDNSSMPKVKHTPYFLCGQMEHIICMFISCRCGLGANLATSTDHTELFNSTTCKEMLKILPAVMVITDRHLNIFKCSANKQVMETDHAMDRMVTTACMTLFFLYIQIKKYISIIC